MLSIGQSAITRFNIANAHQIESRKETVNRRHLSDNNHAF